MNRRDLLKLCGIAPVLPALATGPTIKLQPVPVNHAVMTMPYPGGFVATALVRDWEPGDTRRCQLYQTCTANHERATCTILVDQPVSHEAALRFSTLALTTIGGNR